MINAPTIKPALNAVPANELTIIALAAVIGTYEDDNGNERPEFTVDVLDQAAFDRWSSTSNKDLLASDGMKCECCGQHLKYACLVAHAPSCSFYLVGRSCAARIDSLSRYQGAIEGASIRLIERIKCDARESAWRAANPNAVPALEWARTGINRTAQDIASKLRSYGLSERQTAFLVSLHARDTAARAAATGSASAGRQEITGEVISVKIVCHDDGRRWGSKTYTAKVLIKLATGVKLYGNAPSDCVVWNGETCQHTATVAAGQKVKFVATVEPSDRDPLFGFWKRPSKWSVVS